MAENVRMKPPYPSMAPLTRAQLIELFSAALARLRKAQARLLRRHRVRKNIFAAESASSCAQKIPAPRVYWFILHQCSQSSGNSASLLVVSNRLRLQNRRGFGRGRNSILFGQKFQSDCANILTNEAAVLIISPEISDSVAIEVPFFLQDDLAVYAGIIVNPVINFAGAAAVLF
jgi:hypothetical protein